MSSTLTWVSSVADVAYRHGAAFVEVDLADIPVRRSQILHATGDLQGSRARGTEAAIPGVWMRSVGARIMIHGPGVSDLFDGLEYGAVKAIAGEPGVA